MARFQETLRRLAMTDEGFVEDQAGFGLGLAGISALDPKTAALLPLPRWRPRSGTAGCLTSGQGECPDCGRESSVLPKFHEQVIVGAMC